MLTWARPLRPSTIRYSMLPHLHRPVQRAATEDAACLPPPLTDSALHNITVHDSCRRTALSREAVSWLYHITRTHAPALHLVFTLLLLLLLLFVSQRRHRRPAPPRFTFPVQHPFSRRRNSSCNHRSISRVVRVFVRCDASPAVGCHSPSRLSRVLFAIMLRFTVAGPMSTYCRHKSSWDSQVTLT